MAKLRKYPDGKKEVICRYCKKFFLGGINQKVCFDCRKERNIVRAKKRARKIKNDVLNNKK